MGKAFRLALAGLLVLTFAAPPAKAFNSGVCHQVISGDCTSPRCIYQCLFGSEQDPCQENPDQC